MISFDDNKKIGIGLCLLGLVCMGLGIMLFFDRALLALGNLAFLCGLTFLLGPSKTARFFSKKEKWQGTFFFFLGFVGIIAGYAFIGFVIEIYGAWKLFAAFLPTVINAMKMIPGVNVVLSLPGVSFLCDKVYDQRRLPA
mmetsp:Transcript_47343/g.125355  ORF Transcript_47343/g.125355 Transcript_47343/m.125355 type:complete len:140 (-) Transcript_47343:117-536(-)